MTRAKLEELRQRMKHHCVVEETAFVILTARELHELIDIADKANGAGLWEDNNDSAL